MQTRAERLAENAELKCCMADLEAKNDKLDYALEEVMARTGTSGSPFSKRWPDPGRTAPTAARPFRPRPRGLRRQ
jgi:hypothetical protein